MVHENFRIESPSEQKSLKRMNDLVKSVKSHERLDPELEYQVAVPEVYGNRSNLYDKRHRYVMSANKAQRD